VGVPLLALRVARSVLHDAPNKNNATNQNELNRCITLDVLGNNLANVDPHSAKHITEKGESLYFINMLFV
jgi:hypothetical protein